MGRIILAGGLLCPLLAFGLTFQPRIEQVDWEVEGGRFECTLKQPIARLGHGEFVRRAGEKPTFRIRTQEAWLQKGHAILLSGAPVWQPRVSDVRLGTLKVANNERQAESSQDQAGHLITGLLKGRAPVVRHRSLQGEPLEIRMQPVGFGEAYERYLECAAGLLPVNFEQVRLTAVVFDEDSYELTEQNQAHIDIVLEYMREDERINHIRVDGHSDNRGDRLANRDISRRRALVVKNYLMAHGIKEEQITLFFHGERYPLKPNNSPANRASNRRVSIQLERQDKRYGLTEEQEQEKLTVEP